MHQNSNEAMIRLSRLPLIIPSELNAFNPNPKISVPSKEHIAGQIEIIMKDIVSEGIINEEA